MIIYRWAYPIIFTSIFLVFFIVSDHDGVSTFILSGKDLKENNSSSTFQDVRGYYHSLLADINTSVLEMAKTGDNVSEMAYFCSSMRSNARKIARSYNPSLRHHIISLFLQVRDSYIYGLRYLPISFLNDIIFFFRNKSYYFPKTTLTLEQTRNCLFPSQSRSCPSYSFLVNVRGKSDAEILHSCTKTSRTFDKITSGK